MCGAVMATIWRQYDGSVSVSWYPVMPVLKTISPNVSPSAPKAVPCSVVPSSRTSKAGCATSVLVMPGQLPVEHGGRAAQERGYHPAGQFHPGERAVAAFARTGRCDRLGGRRRVVQGEVGGCAGRERDALPGQPPDPGR